MENTVYFEHGLRPDRLIEGRPVDWTALEKVLKVRLAPRDGMVRIEGSEEECRRAERFFAELNSLYTLRKQELERQDVEQLMRAFREREEGDLKALFAGRIRVGSGKHEILPRSRAQLDYVNLLRGKEVVFGVGPAGTGKTYLAMAVAVSSLLSGSCSRIVLTRPAKEAGENLGFLPGSLEEKIMPYLRPLYDALYDMLDFNEAAALIERNVIEVAPLAFMRGRNSRCVVTGDPSQSDLGRNERSGLVHALKTLRGIPEIGIVEFSTRDVVRHQLLEKIIHAYGAGRDA